MLTAHSCVHNSLKVCFHYGGAAFPFSGMQSKHIYDSYLIAFLLSNLAIVQITFY